MALARTVYVARTAHDLEHANRLQVPKYGVLKVFLSIGSKNSKSYLIPEAPKQKQEAKASDDFYFAPEKEKPKIKYELDDVCGWIKKVTLELLHRDSKDAIWKKELTGDDITHGKHEIEWDGKIDTGKTDFPEEYITVEHSPYKLKLTVEGEAGALNYSPAAWTYLHVLVHSIELEKGVKDAVSRQLDKDLFDHVSLPAEGGRETFYLISNLFSTGADKANNTAFTEYQTLWGDGPNIPVFAKLFVKSSSDGKEDVPKAIGKVRVLWDWEDPKEDVSIHFKQGKEFIKDSIDYHRKSTKPKGDNCHKDRGGKRADNAKPVFPPQAGYAEADALTADTFPFKVESGGTRKWSSYSETWRTKNLMGKTGVMFQPTRMAGDDYIIHAYFPHNRKKDGKDDLDTEEDKELKHAITVKSGTWQVSREIHIIRYYTKNASIPAINFAKVAESYSKAHIKVDDKSGGPQASMASYDTKLRAHLASRAGWEVDAVADGDQGTITQAGILFAKYADFKTKWKGTSGMATAAFNAWLTSNNLASAAAYESRLEGITDGVVVNTCNEYFSASEGINVFQFNLWWVTGDGSESGTNGFAATSFANATLQKAGYIQCRVNYGAGPRTTCSRPPPTKWGTSCSCRMPRRPPGPRHSCTTTRRIGTTARCPTTTIGNASSVVFACCGCAAGTRPI